MKKEGKRVKTGKNNTKAKAEKIRKSSWFSKKKKAEKPDKKTKHHFRLHFPFSLRKKAPEQKVLKDDKEKQKDDKTKEKRQKKEKEEKKRENARKDSKVKPQPKPIIKKEKKTKLKKEKQKKEKKERWTSRKKFPVLLEKAGIPISREKLSQLIFRAAVIIDIIISILIIYIFSIKEGYTLIYMVIVTVFLWTAGFLCTLFLLWLLFYLFLDVKIYQRRIGIEDVFPDFLQLTSANIRAGMPIDQALWHAIRPNFGVLAKEIENVAKQTMTGEALEKALYDFSEKYDSPLIKRSVSLLMEGLSAGGEIGELLDRISNNIQESKTMKKEMAASVTTYAIFITFAAIVAAPFLLALSSQLLVIIENIISTISLPATASSSFAISFSKVGVKPSDFKIFAVITLSITSILSAAIVATIKKGDVREGMKYIPIFILTSLALFFILDMVLGIFLSGIF